MLHVLNSAHGGSALSTFELIERLSLLGITSALICFDNASPEQKKKISNLVEGRVLFIPLYWMNKRIRSAFWKRPLLELLSLWRTQGGYRYQREIADLIRQHKVNIIHTSTILNPEGAIASKLNNIPHVWHVRELIGPSKHFQFYNYREWSRFIHDHCDVLIANSKVTERCLLQFFPASKVTCIPNGIAVESFSVRAVDSDRKKVVVAMVGSLTTRWKNHGFFISVAKEFQGRDDVRFRIYGAIPKENDVYLRHIKSLIKSLGVENLELVPFKTPQQIMSEIDILFHPTEFESFGRIFTEAMAAGIPIVAIDEGGALEMVRHGHNGYLIPKNSLSSAEKCLSTLIADPGLRRCLGLNGRKVVEEHYTLQRLAASIENLYIDAIKSSTL